MPQITGTVTDDGAVQITTFSATANNTSQTFFFDGDKSGFVVTNNGADQITVTANGKTYTINANKTKSVNEECDSFNIVKSGSAGEQTFSLVAYLFHRSRTTEDNLTSNSTSNSLSANQGRVLAEILAESTQIKGTTQSITFNNDGTVQKVHHKDTNNNVLREDIFTYATNLITEVRTLSTGGSLAFKYHLDTLATEVI